MSALIRRWHSLWAEIVGRSGPLLFSRIASTVLTFALPLVLVRLLDRHWFGTYKQFFLVAQTLLLVGQLGLTQSLYYFLPRGSANRGAYVTQVTALLAVVGTMVGAAIWLGAPLLSRALASPDLASLRVPLALQAGAMLAAAPLECTLVSEGRLRQAAIAYTGSDALRAFAMIAAATVLGGRWIFWAAALVAALRASTLWSLLRFGFLPAAAPRWATLRAQLAYALPFAGSSVLHVLQEYLPQYAVSAFFNPATFALFAVASFHMPITDIVYTPMSEVLMVELGRSDGTADLCAPLRHWLDTVERLATLLFPAAAGAWLVGPTLLPLLFTKAYAGAVPWFLLATVEIPLWIFPCDAVLRAHGDTRFLFGFGAVRLCVTAGLVVGGIRLFGVPGAIAAGIASEAFGVTVLLARSRRHLRVGFGALIDSGALGRIAAAAGLAAAPALALRMLLPQGTQLLAHSVVLYVPTYFAARAALRRGRVATAVPVPAGLAGDQHRTP